MRSSASPRRSSDGADSFNFTLDSAENSRIIMSCLTFEREDHGSQVGFDLLRERAIILASVEFCVCHIAASGPVHVLVARLSTLRIPLYWAQSDRAHLP